MMKTPEAMNKAAPISEKKISKKKIIFDEILRKIEKNLKKIIFDEFFK